MARLVGSTQKGRSATDKIMSKPKNIEELRDELITAYEWVKQDPRRANQVKEMTNAAGKVINTLKVQLEYAMLRGERPMIDFLNGFADLKNVTDTPKKQIGNE
jgi:hypothetical protein